MSHSETQSLTVEERMLFQEHGVDPRHEPQLQGFVVVKDAETGRILQAKKNLVVRNGRQMTLRKIFNLPGAVVGETATTLSQKSVMLFGIGSGGTPANDPFNPFSPTPSDTGLSSAIPFRVAGTSNPLPDADVSKYTDGRPGIGGNTDWYKKLFSNGSGVITVDAATDSVYNKLSLQISALDCRDRYVNELALYWTRVLPSGVGMNAKYSDYFIFSRITFLTEPFPAATAKGLDIDYYVYL